MPQAKKVTPKKRNRGSAAWSVAFLTSLGQDANVRAACRAAGVSRQVAYRRRADDPDFAAAWAEALDDAVDQLEQVAMERAKASSDTLLIFLLKSHRPAVYRERSAIEHTGTTSSVVTHVYMPPNGRDDDPPTP